VKVRAVVSRRLGHEKNFEIMRHPEQNRRMLNTAVQRSWQCGNAREGPHDSNDREKRNTSHNLFSSVQVDEDDVMG
jgi:hypothetical protein